MTLFKTIATANGGSENVEMSADEEAAVRAEWAANESAAVENARLALVCTPRQMRIALLQIGDLDAVEAVIAGSPREIQIQWEFSTLLERSHPAWDQLVGAIGKTPADVDALFEFARTL